MNLKFLKILLTSTFFPILTLTSCLNDESNESQSAVEEGNKDKNKITELQKELELLRWETRDFPQITIRMAMRWYGMYKPILWHFDVERTPYTGNATENFDRWKASVQKLLFLMVKEMAHSILV